MRLMSTLMIFVCAELLTACTTEVPTSAGDGEARLLSFSCPTDSDVKIRWPTALTDQELLRRPEYFDLMIAHGTLENLERVLAIANAEHNAGVASSADIARLKEAIAFRRTTQCAEVPSYSAYEFGDVAFDGIAVDFEG